MSDEGRVAATWGDKNQYRLVAWRRPWIADVKEQTVICVMIEQHVTDARGQPAWVETTAHMDATRALLHDLADGRRELRDVLYQNHPLPPRIQKPSTMNDSVFVSDEQIYCATFGAMIARQVMDRFAEGRGAASDEDMDRFAEEANAVALLTLETAGRCWNNSGTAEPQTIAQQKKHIATLEFALNDCLTRLRETTQTIIAETGADGPMSAEEAALKIVRLIRELRGK